jgi:hypothetical protein
VADRSALLVALTVPFAVHTQEFRSWLAQFESVLAETWGEVELYDSPAFEGFPTYGWSWTNPTLSVLFRAPGSDALTLSPGKPPGNEPMLPLPHGFTD